MSTPIFIEISAGELIDRITILQIKDREITDATKLANVRYELDGLERVRAERVPESPAIEALSAELADVNRKLWDVEDDLRELEQAKDFGAAFVELARSVYQLNDRRAALKRAINELVGSSIVEEKSYAGS